MISRRHDAGNTPVTWTRNERIRLIGGIFEYASVNWLACMACARGVRSCGVVITKSKALVLASVHGSELCNQYV